MSETSEAEVLMKTYRDACAAPALRDAPLSYSAMLAVAARARELDAARGGTLDEREISEITSLVEHCAKGTGEKVELAYSAEALLGHLAAQGRTIAAMLDDARRLFRERDEARVTISERDARIAELEGALADAQQDASANAHEVESVRSSLRAAESALATLRQVVGAIVPAIRRGLGKDNGSSTFPLTAARGEWEAILAAHNATPAEHPDTVRYRNLCAAINEEVDRLEPVERELLAMGTKADDPLTYTARQNLTIAKRIQHFVTDPAAEHPDTATLRGLRERANDVDGLAHVVAVATDGRWSTKDVGRAVADHLLGIVPACMARQFGDVDVLNERERECIAVERGLPTPTPEEDWRTVERIITTSYNDADTRYGKDAARYALAALARLRDAPRRAAEDEGREALRRFASRLGDDATGHDADSDIETLEVAVFRFVREEEQRACRRAAEEMRERCAKKADDAASHRRSVQQRMGTDIMRTAHAHAAEACGDVAATIRALEVTP